MRKITPVLAIAGLALGIGIVAWSGFDGVGDAVLSVGWGGFAAMLAWQLLLFLILGAAWDAIMPAGAAPLPVMVWGRMVRDAAATCLPFSQMGGFIVGARAVTLHGVPWPLATGSTIVDVTAEFLAQVAFVALGLIVLLVRAPDSALTLPVAGGLALAVAASAAFICMQHGADRVFRVLGRRIAGSWMEDASTRMEALQAELTLLYRHSGKLALGATFHLLGWLTTAAGGWITYQLLGAELDFSSALAIEALLHVVLTMAFLVPGSLGVQEAGYLSLGAVFGLPPDIALAASLLRRARDLALGVPILLLWQMAEARRLTRQA